MVRGPAVRDGAAAIACTVLWLNMIHHRPQGFDHPLVQRKNWISSTVVGGSMVLNFRLPLDGGTARIDDNSREDASIRVDRDGKVFLTLSGPAATRGVCSSIHSVIAEQMKVAPNRVRVEHALPNDRPAIQKTLETQASSSVAIESTLRFLARAGATARVMLIAAAAKRWCDNPRSCDAHSGEVIHMPTWRKLAYGELAIDAAYGPIPIWLS
jgi:isoquinoline 1-oxidoreductase subunit beta